MANKPFCLATFGEQHAGKTYNLEQWIKGQHRTIVVYNYGWEKDWVGFEKIELLLIKDVLYFTYKKQDYIFSKAFMKKFKNKRVKIKMAFEKRVENKFYQVLVQTDTIKDLTLIIDDATAVFGTTLSRPEKAALSRSKHAGIWMAFASHDPHYFPRQAYGLLTHLRMFKTTNPPPKAKSDIIPCFHDLYRAWEHLQDAPKYSYYTLDVVKKELIYTPYKP